MDWLLEKLTRLVREAKEESRIRPANVTEYAAGYATGHADGLAAALRLAEAARNREAANA